MKFIAFRVFLVEGWKESDRTDRLLVGIIPRVSYMRQDRGYIICPLNCLNGQMPAKIDGVQMTIWSPNIDEVTRFLETTFFAAQAAGT